MGSCVMGKYSSNQIRVLTISVCLKEGIKCLIIPGFYMFLTFEGQFVMEKPCYHIRSRVK